MNTVPKNFKEAQTQAKQNLDIIKNHPTMVKVLADSFGGIMYNVANKYDAADLLAQWNKLTPGEQGAADGTISGAIAFLQGKD